MNKKIVILAAVLSQLIYGCNVSHVYNNREQDKKEGEEVVRKLYKSIHFNDYSNISGLLSPEFLKSSDTTQLFGLFRLSNEKLGTIDSMHLEQWETSVIEGSVPKSNYTFVFIAFRQKFQSKETVKLVKEDGVVKIFSYNIDSKYLNQ